jgi:hypothetical protein
MRQSNNVGRFEELQHLRAAPNGKPAIAHHRKSVTDELAFKGCFERCPNIVKV